MNWTPKQMMAVALARQIEDGKTYIIGTGLPLIGGALAKNTSAPNAHLIFETALFEGSPQEVPTSVSDLRINYQASVLWPQYRYFGFQILAARRGKIAAGFLGGAQIDPYGNLNSTCIGDYPHPQTRFTGSGGANGIATYCDTVIVMKHQKRRFVEHVDYITSPGWGDGPGGRAEAGLDSGRGPRAVITDLGVLRFDAVSRRMYLSECFPGVVPEKVQENTGFELDVSRAVEAVPPSEKILEILIHQVDPLRIMI
ncbi:CoA-transferase subunit beta [Caproiciproducens sp. NJN-50]|uniref:CoA-transferase subunit beta n=1 Tax=Acutalibacteraceae TaxID=3082771 RepID=UPI000FFE02D8|nr:MULTISPECIES: CoA-transferase [Acutalibacteraceae]QAT48370.1 CoA-transferase subunit beta [Caproiciproducens sp. NJN-50]